MGRTQETRRDETRCRPWDRPGLPSKSPKIQFSPGHSARTGLVRGSAFVCHDIPSEAGWARSPLEGFTTRILFARVAHVTAGYPIRNANSPLEVCRDLVTGSRTLVFWLAGFPYVHPLVQVRGIRFLLFWGAIRGT